MNRRDRRRAKVARKKLLLRSNIVENKGSANRCEQSEHRTLFDKVFNKKSGGVVIKCAGIYNSVFCKE